MELRKTFWWTILCGLLLLTTVVPFALAPLGGGHFEEALWAQDGNNSTHYSTQIVSAALEGLYRGSVTSFYCLLFWVWLGGFYLINPNIVPEIKQFIHGATK